MSNFFVRRNAVGWTAVTVEADGLYGVTVLAPHASGDKPRVVKCGFTAGPLDPKTLAELARKISVADCPWTLALGHKTYNILVVPEPTVQADELENSLRWSIGSMVEYPVSEASIAYLKIPTAEMLPNRPTNLYVAAVKKEVIAGYNAIFQQAGISLQAIDVRETAQRNIAALAEAPGMGLGLLSIGKQGMQFIITFNGALYLDRYIEESLFGNVSADTDIETRAYERIALQVQRSLDFIGRTLTFINIDHVLMAPMPDKLAQPDFMPQNIPLPMVSLDLASVFDFSQTPELAQEKNQALYFTPLGAALRFRESSQQIDLQVQQEKSGLSAVWPELSAMTLLLLALLGVWGMRQSEVVNARNIEAASAQKLLEGNMRLQAELHPRQTELSVQIDTLKPQAEATKKMLDQTGGLGSQQGYAEYFSSLASIDEDGLWLNRISVEKSGKSVRLSGRAVHKESILRYARRVNDMFAANGVQFTELELTPETIGNPPFSNIAFNLH